MMHSNGMLAWVTLNLSNKDEVYSRKTKVTSCSRNVVYKSGLQIVWERKEIEASQNDKPKQKFEQKPFKLNHKRDRIPGILYSRFCSMAKIKHDCRQKYNDQQIHQAVLIIGRI